MPPLLPRRTLSLCLAAGLLGGALVGFAAANELDGAPASSAVAAAELGRAPLPAGSEDRGLAGVERSALDLAAALDAVPVRADGDESTRYCAPEALRVRWSAPLPREFAVGGHIDPIGPAPTSSTDRVNGLVVCEGASYAYMGFEARWDGTSWHLAAVPSLSDEHDLHEEEGAHEDEAEHGREHEAPPAATAPRPAPRAPRPHADHAPAPLRRGFSVPAVDGIDPYAAYDPQRICDPVAKPGTAALRDLLLRTYPGSRNLGVSRTCTARGTSEHKEGRAFDWGVNKSIAAERAAAESLLAQLLATDAAGHRHALARRLGVMYLIWDRQIWSAYSADRGWRPYGGANAHTDHVHISLSWDGAMGRTSYWSGANATLLTADPELRLAPGSPPVGGGGAPTKDDGDGDRGPKAVRWTRDSAWTPEPRPSAERKRGRHEDSSEQDEPEHWALERRQRLERREHERSQRKERKAQRRENEQVVVLAVAAVPVTPTDVQSARPRPERKAERPKAERAVAAPAPERQKPRAAEPVAPKPERVTPAKVRVERPKAARPKAERKAVERKTTERPKAERTRTQRERVTTGSQAGRPKAQRSKAQRPPKTERPSKD